MKAATLLAHATLVARLVSSTALPQFDTKGTDGRVSTARQTYDIPQLDSLAPIKSKLNVELRHMPDASSNKEDEGRLVARQQLDRNSLQKRADQHKGPQTTSSNIDVAAENAAKSKIIKDVSEKVRALNLKEWDLRDKLEKQFRETLELPDLTREDKNSCTIREKQVRKAIQDRSRAAKYPRNDDMASEQWQKYLRDWEACQAFIELSIDAEKQFQEQLRQRVRQRLGERVRQQHIAQSTPSSGWKSKLPWKSNRPQNDIPLLYESENESETPPASPRESG